MKKLLTAVLLILALALLALGAFRYLVTDRVTDRGGMENPDCTHTQAPPASSTDVE